MSKADVEWEFETRCRSALGYADGRLAFFNMLNVALGVFALVSLWLSGFVFSGGHENISKALNVAGSISLIIDVVLNVKGCAGFWKSMHDGYSWLFAEFKRIRPAATTNELSDILSRFYDFDGRCSAQYSVLLVVSWNETCVQMGKSDQVKKIPLYKYLTRNFFTWGSSADNFK